MSECAKTHLQQCRISKFSGEDPRTPREGGEGLGGEGNGMEGKGRKGKGRGEGMTWLEDFLTSK